MAWSFPTPTNGGGTTRFRKCAGLEYEAGSCAHNNRYTFASQRRWRPRRGFSGGAAAAAAGAQACGMRIAM